MQKDKDSICSLSLEGVKANIVNKELQNTEIFVYDTTDSTNTRAREHAEGGFSGKPCVFLARGQHAGRGRRGRSFDSQYGMGLYISFLLKPEVEAEGISAFTAKAAVKVCRAIESICGVTLGIKWVNDIFVNGKKLAGILTEGEFNSDGKGFSYLVLGIGINLVRRTFPEELSEIATTLEDASGEAVDANLLAAKVITELLSDSSCADFMEEYRRRSTVIGKTVEVRRLSGETFYARAESITDSGALVVSREGGQMEELISAEVSIRPC